jgi:hypothetical protein
VYFCPRQTFHYVLVTETRVYGELLQGNLEGSFLGSFVRFHYSLDCKLVAGGVGCAMYYAIAAFTD